jgi:hypothetical protein
VVGAIEPLAASPLSIAGFVCEVLARLRELLPLNASLGRRIPCGPNSVSEIVPL